MQRAGRVSRARAKTSGRSRAVSAPSQRAKTGTTRAGSATSSLGRTSASRARAATRPASKRASRGGRGLEARCRSIFTTAVALLIAVTSLGLARVAVIARAAEMTISADSLSKRIKEQRVQTDQLEVDRSSLTAPSRIEAIAADTMSMGDPASVSYIVMPESEAGENEYASDSAQGRIEASSTSAKLGSLMSALLDMSAGEAQSLLVGDLALAGSR